MYFTTSSGQALAGFSLLLRECTGWWKSLCYIVLLGRGTQIYRSLNPSKWTPLYLFFHLHLEFDVKAKANRQTVRLHKNLRVKHGVLVIMMLLIFITCVTSSKFAPFITLRIVAEASVLLLVAADSGANVCITGAHWAPSHIALGAVDSLKKKIVNAAFIFCFQFLSLHHLGTSALH